MRVRLFPSTLLLLMMMAAAVAGPRRSAVPRTPDGKPDLSGFYDANTLTPMDGSPQFTGRRILTDDEAAALVRLRRPVLSGR